MESSPLLTRAILFSSIAMVLFLRGGHAQQTAGAVVTRHYQFDIQWANVTRLCGSKSIVTVNGQFPGPKIVAREGDRVVVKVINHVQYNVTLHWHGIRQLRSGWADGPAYVTQCPIQTGRNYVYNFTIVGQRGTLFWHAHISWLRDTLYGPIVILPRIGDSYPFAKPYREVPIIFGEWWKADTEAVISQALQTGGGPNVSDAYTINGLPGPSYNCSAKDTFKLKVKPGKTYLLRIINAALNDELFFGVAGHNLTVVDVDAVYVKPLETDALVVSPGQTTNVLLHAKPKHPNASFLMAVSPFHTGSGTFDNSTATAILEYYPGTFSRKLPLHKPTLPALNDTSFAANFSSKLRSLVTSQFPANVPRTVDRRFLFTVGLGLNPCPANQTCQGPNGTKFAASVNNVSFVMPTTALLQSHFFGRSRGVYTPDFPYVPAHAIQLHRDSSQQHVREQRHQADGAPVQRQRRTGDARHQRPRGREPPAAPPWLQLLRPRSRVRQLRPLEGPLQVQPGGPCREEHSCSAGRRLGGPKILSRQPRCLVHALSLGSAHELGPEDGMAGPGRKPS